MTSGAPDGGFFVQHVAAGAAPVPAGLRGAVVAIGNFDGLHRGHAAVIGRARAIAAENGRPCAVCSFEPHPADVFAGGPVIFRLTPEAAKVRALGSLGVDGLFVLRFDAALARLPPERFVADILVDQLGVAAVVVGYDFHYGAGRAGTPDTLAEAGREHGFAVTVIDRIGPNGAGDLSAVSSTAIRDALERGEVRRAAGWLGHDWFVLGPVLHGRKLGRTLGYPTANMALDPSCRLRHGIYAVTVRGEGLAAGGVASFGLRPTVDQDGAPLLETVLFDFAGDLYGRVLEVGFVDWIRGEEKFDGLPALMVAMRGDEARARAILAERWAGEARSSDDLVHARTGLL